jgi:multiple sugar transport system substrate-binding protein
MLLPSTACADVDQVPVINLYYAPEENLPQVIDECNTQAEGRYRIDYQVLPRGADDQRVQLVRRLAAEDQGMDILGLDVTWTQEFASAEWIREWTGDNQAVAEQGTLEGPLESARYEGRLYAAPKNTNVQLLWYRTDLVDEPPQTWDELIAASQRLREQGQPHQVITMGAQYEGLVVLYNTLVASAGGAILTEDGSEVALDEDAVRALGLLRDFATAGVTSPSFPNAMEDDVRLEFQGGNGAFQLNWPFVYPAMQEADPEFAANVGWARVPAVDPDQPSQVTIGGFNLAVSAYSRYPEEAFEAALCLRSPEHQLFSAVNDGVPPTIEAVYDEPEMDEAYPMKEDILATLLDGANRPLSPAYQNISTVTSSELSPPAAIDPEVTAQRLRDLMQEALDSRGVLP